MRTINLVSMGVLLFALTVSAMHIAHEFGYEYAKKTWVNPRGE